MDLWYNVTYLHPKLHHFRTQPGRMLKSYHEDVFNFKQSLLIKIWVHNNMSSSEKSISCCLSHQNPVKYLFIAVLLDLCRYLSWFRPDCFFNEGSVIMDYGLVLELKTSSWWICFSFCLLQMLTDVVEWCGLLWFLSALILTAPIHCRASVDEQVMECICSDEDFHF